MLVCKGKQKFTSIFTFAHVIQAAIGNQQVKDLLAQPNFLIIDSLYDLPAETATNTPPDQYRNDVLDELGKLYAVYQTQPFNFKFGIPASCSYHECAGDGRDNLVYVQAAFAALKQFNDSHPGFICGNPQFKGIALWAYDYDATSHASTPVLPPSNNVMNFIKSQGSSILGCRLNGYGPVGQ